MAPDIVYGSWRAWIQTRLRIAWARRGILACSLRPLAFLYGVAAARTRDRNRQQARERTQPAVPVIVVGNVIAGGAGKTPTTIALVEHLSASGWHPGIVSRGYGRASTEIHLVSADSSPADAGDEPLLMARRTGVPVAVGRDRVAAAHALLAHAPNTDVLLCDDGLQHLALARDIEICVFDNRGTGNGWLLPAGPLREPWPRTVDLILCTSAHAPDIALPTGTTLYTAARALAAQARRADGSQRSLEALAERPVIALAGIARPEPFFAMLRGAGLTLARTIALADHADPSRALGASSLSEPLVCTEKDAVKLWRIRPDAWAVPLQLDVPPAFFAHLDTLLAAVVRPKSLTATFR